ncbi:MAG TPA: penicillin-binding transpeptidase domain-containing protein, partial [Candidatus Paceibacterota bacterium]|nr:penicillin-binding transpeptidase domain-containing protein [Candidatus Paceibacterota bacterium]
GGFGDIAGLGVSRIVSYLTKTLADSILGIDLPGEQHGFVPTADWKKSVRGEPWYLGDTYNISIGQGDLTVTPLWLNTYVSAIANGGTMYKPEVVNRIVDEKGNPIQIFKPQSLEQLPFRSDVVATVKSDMQETILSGTATLLKDLPVTAGAKTGTAQVVNGQKINSLFTIFAPLDHPKIAMTILVESPNSEGLAIVTANDILKWYFTQGKGNPSAALPSPTP